MKRLKKRVSTQPPSASCNRPFEPLAELASKSAFGTLGGQSRVDRAMVKAIARAHRWRGMLESGIHATIAELAAAERINQSYVCRILRLTLLAPDIIEKILDGQQSSVVQLAMLLKPLPFDWRDQRRVLGAEDCPG